MKLFIAEKPELGRAIAAGLDGSYKSEKTYIVKGDNIVTWAFGHILALKDPKEYKPEWEHWSLDSLPLKIEGYNFRYKPLAKSSAQLEVIKSLINRSDVTSIVHCGDADDEGQVLIDEILQYVKNKKPVERLLINDNTEKGVRAALKKIRPNSEFKGMSERGFARSQADWLVGINLTRAYTTKAKEGGFNELVSVGRVQTPILAMVVNRDKEHEGFNKSYYYTISGEFGVKDYLVRANLKTDEKILDESVAQDIKKECETGQAKIDFVKTEHKTENPPLPYSLLKLQVDCAKYFGFSADKTLKVTQSLREVHKAITYNRSDCEYLPMSVFEESPQIVSTLKSTFEGQEMISDIIDAGDTSIRSVAFNDANITAHHAIVPTAQKVNLGSFTPDEKKVYLLIVKRFLVQFFSKKEYDSTQVQFSIGSHKFQASQTNVTKHTFDTFLSNVKDDDEEDENDDNGGIDLRKLSNTDSANLKVIDLQKKETKPRPYYTMATLLKDLTGVAKYVKDERIKKLLIEKDKDKKGENGGIGTPATRSAHLENLEKKGYITVSKDKKQTIKSTLKGKTLIAVAPHSLTAPDMTALWFEQQKDIEQNKITRHQFLDSIMEYLTNEVAEVKGKTMGFTPKAGSANFTKETVEGVTCPKCGGALIHLKGVSKTTKKPYDFFKCENETCDFKCSPDKNGKPELNPQPKAPQDIVEGVACPDCGSPIKKLIGKTGRPWFGCTNWKDKCQFRCGSDNGGNPDLNNRF